MDVSALGAAATQISGAQRQQQASLSGIKSAQVQAQSLIAMLTEATAQATQTRAAPQPVNSAAGTTDAAADRRLPRGSIVNILA